MFRSSILARDIWRGTTSGGLFALAAFAPGFCWAQASPFMTGATALQTNARVAREYLVALPVELSAKQRLDLVRGFSQDLSNRYGFALDLTIHAPRDYPDSDNRNFHAHLLATTRQVSLAGLGMKTTLEMNDNIRREMGLGPAIQELFYAREKWAAVTNGAMRAADVAARIDHRSLQLQGIDREPRPQIPRAAFEMERHGYRSPVAERIRAEHAQRVKAREQMAAARDKPAAKPQSLEEIRREARENWLRMRQSAGSAPTHEPSDARRNRHDDLSK